MIYKPIQYVTPNTFFNSVLSTRCSLLFLHNIEHILQFWLIGRLLKLNIGCPLRLDEARVAESEEVKAGVILDYDENENVIGVEFLNVSKRATKEELSTMQFQTA